MYIYENEQNYYVNSNLFLQRAMEDSWKRISKDILRRLMNLLHLD